jgi:hypothetical protein
LTKYILKNINIYGTKLIPLEIIDGGSTVYGTKNINIYGTTFDGGSTVYVHIATRTLIKKKSY